VSVEITIVRSGLDLNIVSEELKEEVAQKLISRLADLAWFTEVFELKGKKAPVNYVRNLIRFGFFKKANDRFSLSDQAQKFLESDDTSIVYSVLNSKVLGFDDILYWLGQGQMTKDDAKRKLMDKYPYLTWDTHTQTYYRLTWLMSLGYVQNMQYKYFLTDEGKRILKRESNSKGQERQKKSLLA
jgi:hypothetical protein